MSESTTGSGPRSQRLTSSRADAVQPKRRAPPRHAAASEDAARPRVALQSAPGSGGALARPVAEPADMRRITRSRRSAKALDSARRLREAQQALKDRQDILGVVSHDLQTPISAILLSTALLQQEGPAVDSSRSIALIRRAAESMLRMTRDLLDGASIEAGRLSLSLGRHALRDVVEGAAETMAPLAVHASVRLEIELPAEPVALRCDRDRVAQVLSNLIGNAIKFSPPGGRVSLRVALEAGCARFTVSDQGPGLAPDQLEQVFGRYWRAPDATSKGAGLGLFICKGIVEAHGGQIGAAGRVGEGCAFSFTLPLAPAAGQRPAPRALAPRPGSGR